MDMPLEYRMYNQIMKIFLDQISSDICCDSCYDVDMFRRDICHYLFDATDSQDIDEDGYLTFQEALILLVRDDTLLHWFGISGLCILHADLMDDGEAYYINKVLFREA